MGLRFGYPATLTYDQDQVLLGSLFGDGCMRRRSPGATPYFVEHHAEAQVEYLRWKAEVFQPFRPKISFNARSKWRMLTGQAPIFESYRTLFYPDGKKVLPMPALGRIDALALAVWCMDDGSRRKDRGGFILSTNQWPLEDQHSLVEWFRSRWAITCAPDPVVKTPLGHHPTWRLRFRLDETVPLLRLIEPHLHPLFQEKWRVTDPTAVSPAVSHADRGRLGRALRVAKEGARRAPRDCANCGRRFIAKTSEIARGGARYCSPACYHAHTWIDRRARAH